MTFHLTLADVKTKGLAAYHAKQLSAQGPTPACRYRDASGRPCIVGAALPDDVAAALPQTQPVWGLRGTVDVELDDQREVEDLHRIHDVWATLMGVNSRKQEVAERLFKGLNNYPHLEVTPANIEALLVERLS